MPPSPDPRALGPRLPGYAILKGIPSIQPEAGHAGEMDEALIALIFGGILNVMKRLKMIDGRPDKITGSGDDQNGTRDKAEEWGNILSQDKTGRQS